MSQNINDKLTGEILIMGMCHCVWEALHFGGGAKTVVSGVWLVNQMTRNKFIQMHTIFRQPLMLLHWATAVGNNHC